MKRKLLLAALCVVGALGGGTSLRAQTWTDKTDQITNPSFETDDAVSDATKNNLKSATVTGWTVLPTTSVNNAQAAVVNSSSTLSVLSGSDGATAGSKYFYVRQNWNETGNFGIQQTLSDQPEGLYLLTCKIKTSSSSPNATKWYLSLQEDGEDAAVNSNAGSAAEWLSNGVVVYKKSASTTLTISAYMVAGASGNSQNYAMLLDDFELKYISPSDMAALSASSSLDMSGAIYNAGIYNATKTTMPRGWIAYQSTRGNSNFTEGTGDTQLEGWSGSNMNIDYYQPVANLPVGKYTVTAYAHDSNDKGAVVYGWCNDGSGEGDMGSGYADITTSAFNIINGSVNIGIKHNGGASWVTGDNFRLTYQGIQPYYAELYAAATAARDNSDYAGVLGKEKSDLEAAIALAPSTYTDYISACEALSSATATFTAAKDTYARCVTEYATYTSLSGTAEYASFITSSTTGTDVLNAIKTAEYTAVTTKYTTDGSALFIASWDNSNFDALTSQHWSGQTSTYYDKWNGSAFTSSISKTVTLPEGHYVFYAAGRGQANSASSVTLKVSYGETEKTAAYTMQNDTGYGIETSGMANYTSSGTYANNNLGRGWEWRYIAFDLDAETDVTLKIEGTGNNSWVSACDTKLVTYDNIAVSRSRYEAAKEAAEAARDNTDYNNVVGTERTALLAAINAEVTQTYEGYDEAAEALEAATPAFTAAKTNYDALVNEIAKAKALGIADATADGYAATSSSTAATALSSTQSLKVAEYTYVTTTYQYGVELSNTAWTTTGETADNRGQHWDGTGTSTYKEQLNGTNKGYSASSWSIGFNQDVALPAGNYVFKVAGRKASGSNSTLTLEVKNGDTSLGTVADFPEGDTGKGIDTDGATNFGDGTYANNNNGRGWEWRYVKFTLDEDATVNVAVNAEATALYQWISFCDYTLQTDNEANIALIAYNIALNEAKVAKANTDYANVTGDELTALTNAISAEPGTTKESIEAATTALTTATTNFTAAKSAYDAWVAARDAEYAELDYASADKYEAVTTAKAATPATASDATTAKATLIKAYRKYVESNALAEGVEGAESVTISDPNMEVTYDATAHTFGAWQVIGQTNGTINLYNEQSFTDGDDNANYKYADISKNDNNAGIQQTVNLAPGRYLMTVTARCASTSGASFKAFAGGQTTDIPRIGATGGVFDRGWNDVSVEFVVTETSDVNIGVQSGNGKNIWWSATRFRLVKLAGTETVETTIASANKWATFIAPFDVTIPTGARAYTIEANAYDSETGVLTVTSVDDYIPANMPVVLYSTTGAKIEGTGVSQKEENSYTHGLLTGVYERIPAPNGSYILQKHDGTDNAAFYKVDTSVATPNVPANRAYLTLPESNAKAISLSIDDDEATAIAGIEALVNGNMEGIYTMDGKKVDSLQKGINIVKTKDGKAVKMFVK